MKEGGHILPTTTATASAGGNGAAAPLSAAASPKPSSSASDAALFGRGRYKFFWALGAILLLASWSMLTGTVTLRWSAGDLNRLADDLDAPIYDDLDVLEMEEREKMVRHMWDVYANGRPIRLPRFWQQAFEAVYEELAGDDTAARDAVVAELARMSIRMVDLAPLPPTPKRSALHKDQRVEVDKSTLNSSLS